MTKAATAGADNFVLLEARHVDNLTAAVNRLAHLTAEGNQLATKQLAATRELIQALAPTSLNGAAEHGERRKAKR